MCQSNLASWIARSLINTFAEMPCQYQDTWVGEFFFVAAWNIFWRAQHLKLMEWLKISVSFWGHDPTYLRALLHHRCLRFVHVINQFCQLLFCFTLFVKSSRFNVQNRDIIILMAMIVTIRWFSCLGAWFWTQRKDHQGRNYYLRWDCPLNTWWVYNRP